MQKGLMVATSFLALAATSAPAWAGWGCGYRFAGLSAGRYGSVWGLPSEEAARDAAMHLCTGSPGQSGCHIVGCADNIDTAEQAGELWPLGGAASTCLKNGRVVPASPSGTCD